MRRFIRWLLRKDRTLDVWIVWNRDTDWPAVQHFYTLREAQNQKEAVGRSVRLPGEVTIRHLRLVLP